MATLAWVPVVLLPLLIGTPSHALARHHNKRGAVAIHPEVATEGGIVVGAKAARDTGDYFAFKGIPYAAPPLGELRFKGPRPAQPWGRREAFQEGPKCPQYTVPAGREEGQEDCLYLNVYVPTLGRDELPIGGRLPVMVYIHGGGFFYGSGTAAENGPEFIVHHQVILVTINYRLGALGFLNLDTDDFPGNMGLKDQRAALQWVRRNIAEFGGDPDNVTIFGNSAGASSVHFHSIVPASEGLFHAAIMQSGNALAPFAYQETHLQNAQKLSEQLTGNKSSSTERMAESFRNANCSAILAATQRMIAADPALQLGSPAFCPSPERRPGRPHQEGGEDMFLTQDPESLMRQPKVRAVPTIAGMTGEEGYYAEASLGLNKQPALEAALSQNPASMLPPGVAPYPDTARLLGLPQGVQVSSEQAAKFNSSVKEEYQLPGNNSHFVALLSDLLMGVPTHRFVDLRLSQRNTNEAAAAPLYLYHFLEAGDYNWGKITFNLTVQGATHTDELGYLMHITSPYDLKQSLYGQSSSSKALYLLTKMWTDFAKTKVPNPALWPAAEGTASSSPYVQVASNTLTTAHGLSGRHMAPWDDIYAELRMEKQ